MNINKRNFVRCALAVMSALIGLTHVAAAQDVITYYHTDLTGSAVAGSDINGNIVWREDFTPYGERRQEQLSAGSNRRWYTGHPHEDFTGLTYAGARHYDPMTGRFMGVDPASPSAENQFSFNGYAYANNNPYRYVDPDGREVVLSNSKDKERVEQWINSRALGHFEFNEKNRLVQTGAKGDHNHHFYSKYYQRRLVEAINSKSKISIEIAQKYWYRGSRNDVDVDDPKNGS